jgi:tRNA modification GTPase
VPSPDTIVAIATPAGRGAVGIVRVSGALVPRLAVAVLGYLPAARRAEVARFLDAAGDTLDQGLALYFPAPASFTGEHVLELHGHGGAVVADLLVRRLLQLGCRQAKPGEFTERAFLNGKIDVAQAEAVADLIDAGTAAAARAAVRSLQGEFSAHIRALQSALTGLRTQVEAAIDFPDEETEPLDDGALGQRLAAVCGAMDSLAAAARQGALLREGLTVVIAGKPNAGKSTLLNRLAGEEIAIVTDAPGTTRDLLRQPIHIDGLPVNLIDTAGLREAADPAEAEGIRRARGAMQHADRVLYVLDAARPQDTTPAGLAAELAPLPPGVPVTLVFSKIDLSGGVADADLSAEPARIRLSARSGAGLDLLRAHLKSSAGFAGTEGGAFSARRRHLDALNRARGELVLAAAALRETRATELIAEHLRLAQRALGEITGEFTSEDLLGEIFSSFCIGK